LREQHQTQLQSTKSNLNSTDAILTYKIQEMNSPKFKEPSNKTTIKYLSLKLQRPTPPSKSNLQLINSMLSDKPFLTYKLNSLKLSLNRESYNPILLDTIQPFEIRILKLNQLEIKIPGLHPKFHHSSPILTPKP